MPASGWYPDPASAGQERFWDGGAWTTHTRPVTAAEPPPVTTPHLQRRTQPPDQHFETWQASTPAAPIGPATADGFALAGWWPRAGALLVDLVVVGLLVALAAMPFYDSLSTGFTLLYEDVWRAGMTGGATPDPYDPRYGLVEPLGSISLISAAIGFVHSAGMQIWRGGTVGMLLVGLRVVPVDRGQDHNGLPLVTALLRNLVFQLASYFSIVAVINYLLPLGNRKRQTLHDMAARTQVVKIR